MLPWCAPAWQRRVLGAAALCQPLLLERQWRRCSRAGPGGSGEPSSPPTGSVLCWWHLASAPFPHKEAAQSLGFYLNKVSRHRFLRSKNKAEMPKLRGRGQWETGVLTGCSLHLEPLSPHLPPVSPHLSPSSGTGACRKQPMVRGVADGLRLGRRGPRATPRPNPRNPLDVSELSAFPVSEASRALGHSLGAFTVKMCKFGHPQITCHFIRS